MKESFVDIKENIWLTEEAKEIDRFWSSNIHELAIHTIEAVVCMHYLQPGESTLEVGCGTGRLYEAFKTTGRLGAYTGFDKSPAMLDLFKQRYPEVSLVVGDASSMPFEDGEFDAVICCEVIRHLINWQEVISELYRVAKKTVMFSMDLTDGPTRKLVEDRGNAYLKHTEEYLHYQIEHNPSEVLGWLLMTFPCGITIRTLTGNKWIIILQKDGKPGNVSIKPVEAMNSLLRGLLTSMETMYNKLDKDFGIQMNVNFSFDANLDVPVFVDFKLEVVES